MKLLAAVAAVLAITACAAASYHEPDMWRELSRVDLALMCRDPDPNLRGCILCRADVCVAYSLEADE